jgi:hypothetical protein
MVEREPRKEIVLDSVVGLNIYGHLLWGTPHLVITKSIKSKKKESRQLVGCFLLCMGQNYAGSNFFFFFFLAWEAEPKYIFADAHWPIRKDFKRQISKFKKRENLADVQAWVGNEREFPEE